MKMNKQMIFALKDYLSRTKIFTAISVNKGGLQPSSHYSTAAPMLSPKGAQVETRCPPSRVTCCSQPPTPPDGAPEETREEKARDTGPR